MDKHYINKHGVEFYCNSEGVFVSYAIDSESQVQADFKTLEECLSYLNASHINEIKGTTIIQSTKHFV